MKIISIETHIVAIPVSTPYHFSHGVLKAFSNVLIWIRADDGTVGVGESAYCPGGGVREETPEGTKEVIDGYLAPEILNEDPFDIERIHQKMDACLPGNLVAKAGIDLALWDLMGKVLERPAYKLLGGLYESKIRVTYTLSMDTPERMAEQAIYRVEQGYRTLVIKIGDDVDADLERLRQVREAVGPGIMIRLDANEAYRPDQAITIIRKMERYDPEFVEEPVKRWDIDGMARVAHAVDTPISSDESNSTLQSVFHLLEKEAADIINIKISKNGGLYNCRKIAAVAQAKGVPCLIGGDNTYEITRQASRHLATCTRQVQLGYGSEGCGPASQSKIDDIARIVVTYEDVKRLSGYVEATPGPGLGVELDEDKVHRYLVR